MKAGEYSIEGHESGSQALIRRFVTIADKAYTTQHITIKDKRKVNPEQRDYVRISAESKRKHKAARDWSNAIPDMDFLLHRTGTRTPSPLERGTQRYLGRSRVVSC
jgi:hypothetical protein